MNSGQNTNTQTTASQSESPDPHSVCPWRLSGEHGLPALPALVLLLRTAWLHAFVVTIKCDSAFKAFSTVLDIHFQRLALTTYGVVL